MASLVTPPRAAQWILRIATPPTDRAFLLADLHEEFSRMVLERGMHPARAWYWRQAMSSVAPLTRDRSARMLRRVGDARHAPRVAFSDFSQSIRWLRRNPGTVSIVVTTLTVALATVIATFSVINATLLRPLPFVSPDRIINVWATGPTVARAVRSTSRPNFEDWRDGARSFAALSAYSPLEFRLTGRGEPRELVGIRVERDFDRVLGLQPAFGRLFGPADYAAAFPTVAVISHEFWISDLGRSPRVIGELLQLDGRAYEIVGVLPRLDVTYPLDRHQFWVPLIPREGGFWEHSRGTGWLSVVGRVRDDVTVGSAQAELTTIAGALAQQHPDSNRGRTEAVMSPISVEILGPISPMLRLLSVALLAVLLVACGNVANLLLVSVAQRRREFAVRAAMGAAGSRLGRQVLGETALMCAAAAGLGLVLSPLMVSAFVALYPGDLPRAVPRGVDGTAVLAAIMLAATATLLLGVPQAIHARRINIRRGMTISVRTTGGRGDRALRGVLVTAQVALSFVLIVAGVGFVRTLDRLSRVETGYNPEGVLTFTVAPSPAQASGTAALQFYDAVVTAIAELPSVRAAAAAVAAPMTTGGWRFGVRPQGASADVLVGVNLTTPGYFESLGIRTLEGRLLTADEQRRGTAVAVVNEPLARLLGGDVVGRHFDYSDTKWQIVGVVEGIRHGSPRDEPAPELIIPWHMAGRRPQSIIVRADGDVLSLLPAIAARVHAIDPTAPLGDVARLGDRFRDGMAAERFRATMLATLAAIAVALAALGAYSVTAYTVAHRTREYGIRLALGERPMSVGRRALATAVVPSIVGIAAGGAISVATSRWMEAFLYQVKAVEWVTIVCTGVTLLLIALMSGASSARRAATVDPAGTLAVE
jgi:putative ABC transport system permease protein